MKNNILKKSCLHIAVVGFCISIILGFLYLIVFCINWGSNGFTWGFLARNIASQLQSNIGDFLWGTLGILFTFTTTIFLFITFKEQREQLQKTKEESDKIRFETTYFNILGMLKQVQDTVNTNIATRMSVNNIHNIVDFYENFHEKYNEHLVSKSDLRNFNDNFKPLQTNTAEIEQYKDLIAIEYEEMIVSVGCNIGYLYRYIYNAMKFVLDDPYNQNDNTARDRYLNLLQAQLSNEELCFIFYDAISKFGKNKEGVFKFKQMLDDTHFLENIDPTFLLNRNHYKFYPKTKFKFLNRTELADVNR